MGFQLAARLLDAGHDVAVYNRTRARAEPLAERGARSSTGRPGASPPCPATHVTLHSIAIPGDGDVVHFPLTLEASQARTAVGAGIVHPFSIADPEATSQRKDLRKWQIPMA
ncbi:NAD(P)-binding domain-containing protein [Kitasatospora sp. NPDC087861]